MNAIFIALVIAGAFVLMGLIEKLIIKIEERMK